MFLNKRWKDGIYLGFFILLYSHNAAAIGNVVKVSEKDFSLLIDESKIITTYLTGIIDKQVEVFFNRDHVNLLEITPSSLRFEVNGPQSQNVTIVGLSPGRSGVWLNSTSTDIDLNDAYFNVTVQHSEALNVISEVVGWIYFAAWSISFYPQIYINYKRKSVVGLNFDYICLNIIGFILYSMFNCGLFFIQGIKDLYFESHPRGLNPVQIQDVVFGLHAALATLITICQCFVYERANQRVSITARVILSIFGVIILVSIILAATVTITWLDFLYYCSYIKLSITLIKYVPQAYMNYRRKSTIGWSIGNIILDFVGGTLSMLQMIINAYNFDDWASIFGDPTKFGLGLFSVVFDIFFMIQHYILYRDCEGYIEIGGEDSPRDETDDNPVAG